MYLVGFIIRIYHDARSPERQIEIYFWIIIFCFSNKTFNNTIFVRMDVNKCQLSFKSSTCNSNCILIQTIVYSGHAFVKQKH